jgi:UDP-N-acetyl-D-galactosamine dehydrogenase
MERQVSVVGLGYVGFPVAVEFGKLGKFIGFDINEDRLTELRSGVDSTKEVDPEDMKSLQICYTSNFEDLKKADFHIVAVPTPVNSAKQPDLSPMIKASETVGKALKQGDIVVYESTVYPGATEEDCIPVLEKFSGLKAGVDFKVGYSPERINPGDKKHTLRTIIKVVSAQDDETLDIVASVYEKVVDAGIHRASSIKVAEAAKVIENTQRDINIAFVNELSMIFEKMGFNTLDVLEAAGTKWNFLNFRPGLVGGHCIGVDPYYLTHKAGIVGYHPEIILSGRRINDGIGKFIAEKTVKELIHAGVHVKNSVITILGLTFKEDCPDLRNTRVIDIIEEFRSYGIEVQVNDPECKAEEAKKFYDVNLVDKKNLKPSDAVIVAVAHSEYLGWEKAHINDLLKESKIIVDVKSAWKKHFVNDSAVNYWGL